MNEENFGLGNYVNIKYSGGLTGRVVRSEKDYVMVKFENYNFPIRFTRNEVTFVGEQYA